jgi:hypothetical protein
MPRYKFPKVNKDVPAELAAARSKTHFKVGNSGGGRPKGSRDRLSNSFIIELCADFTEHGKSVIESVRLNDPSTYMKVIAGLMPKEVEIKRPLEDLTEDELIGAIELIRAALAGNTQVDPSGIGNEAVSKPH